MGGVALSVERLPVLSPLSDSGAEGIASPDVQLFIRDVELFGPGLSKSIPCLRKKITHEFYLIPVEFPFVCGESVKNTVRERERFTKNLPIKKVQPKAFHSRRAIIAEGARFHHVVLTDVLVLKVSAHRDLSLESSITYRAMVRQSLRMRREVLRKVVLPKESFLTYPALVRLHARMPHLEVERGSEYVI